MRFHADILLGRTIHRHARSDELHAVARRGSYLQLVVKPAHGVHYGAQIVIPVVAATQHVEPEVYFAISLYFHNPIV